MHREWQRVALRQDKQAWNYIHQKNCKKFLVKESDILIDILFNEDIDVIKDEEIKYDRKPKPI
jgi:hypothetical protein